MKTKILLIDAVQKHRQVIRTFLSKTHPDIELIERDPHKDLDDGVPIDWQQYFLLIIDNQLGDLDGLDWVKNHSMENGFPAFIFLSSSINPDSTESSAHSKRGMQLGADAYLYKKNLNSDKLNTHICSALEKSGAYSALTVENDMFHDSDIEDTDEAEITLSADVEEESVSLNSTLHQMSHAKALLHGYEDWPFDIRDMLAGKAQLDGYLIDTYLGKRDDVFSFSARKIEDSEPCVLKLIDRSTIRGREPPESLLKDLQTLVGIKHDNLVHRHDFKAARDYVLIIEELIQGKKLSTRLKKIGTTEDQAVKYILQILSALKYLHDHGMQAGALSPDNLLFRDENTLVLTHFNNCYYPKQDSQSRGLKFNYQEALYTPPEVIQGRKSDHRSDLYIAGTIFYHMLAGTPPYHGSTTQDVITEHVASPVPALPQPKHPMNMLITRLLMKTPSQRIQTADEAMSSIRGRYRL